MDQIVDEVWARLHAGASAGKERSPFTMLQVATIALDGAPAVRTVVLRRASREQRSVMFHTDVRSTKVAELRRDPRISLVGCDLDGGIQIRLDGVARIVETPPETRAVWSSSRPRTLIVYRTPLAPATPVASPVEAHAATHARDPDSSAGFENFCLIDVTVSRIDYLDLNPTGHRRASLVFEEGKWRGTWLAP
ncbi:pyridoxamine 5'-phosphate oxidase family protein [Paraburkholderia sp. CNPSo 3281]|uniref:pyridoxamine 5'-phosphate oxidase family protein n=1 Tax=Paraburkholderia sp. CNPSo 3281 TaxID=2940933 RepID=UPI0020B7BBE6|nr:pyridoxamine 5'-phosphate oxidase family protein [Paraburkholderia sp. CNPSo 3281]MCP3720487.1 pyridoxamine 5'-phosphate oxidase family protein [Paraburkholderia sp. CNPSo 3281]